MIHPILSYPQPLCYHVKVIFDTDPAPSGVPVLGQVEMMAQAMIRGVMDESGEQFVAYFLPTDQTLEKRRDDFRKVLLFWNIKVDLLLMSKFNKPFVSSA